MSCLIASHSQGRYFSKYHAHRSDVLTSFHPGFRVEQLFGTISDLIPAFDVVVLHIGANNLGHENAETVFNRYLTLFSEIRMKKPGVKIVVSAILPRAVNLHPGARTTNLTVINERASDVNDLLFRESQRRSWLSMARHPTFVPVNRRLYANDGLHFSFAGAKLVVSNILVLKSLHNSARRDPDDINIPKDICDPEKIIDLVKAKIEIENKSEQNNVKIETNDNLNQILDDVNVEDATKLDDEIPSRKGLSQKSLAIATVNQKRVHHVPNAKAFIVEGSKNDKYAVELYPKEKCQCPSTGTCYHILAVKISIGLEDDNIHREFNLTKLRKNSRKRLDKKAGQKKPRPIDKLDENNVTINPAPDATILNEETLHENCISPVVKRDSPMTTPQTKHSTPKCSSKKKSPKSILKKIVQSNKQKSAAKKRINFDIANEIDSKLEAKKRRLSLTKSKSNKLLEFEISPPKVTSTPLIKTEIKNCSELLEENVSFTKNQDPPVNLSSEILNKQKTSSNISNNDAKRKRLSLPKKNKTSLPPLPEIIEIRGGRSSTSRE